MATIKDYTISSVGEPACIKIEKNSKGYNYEVSLHEENLDICMQLIFEARRKIEIELGVGGTCQK